MLSAALLSVAAISTPAFASPSKCVVRRKSGSGFRNDPYAARVTPFSPAKATSLCSTPQAVRSSTTTTPRPASLAGSDALIAAFNNQALLRATSLDIFAPVAAVELLPPTVPVPTEPVPSAASQRAATMKWAMVRFKHESALYIAPFRVAEGDLVVVEADRGEHQGVVETITDVPPRFNVPCKITRHATAADVDRLALQREKESLTAAQVQKLAESCGLGIQIVDVEFQADGNKLTVYFSSKCFVDFRKLQRSLFREHRCRIWLINWNEVRRPSCPGMRQ